MTNKKYNINKSNNELNKIIDNLNSIMFNLNEDGTITPRNYENEFISIEQLLSDRPKQDRVISLQLLDKDWLDTDLDYNKESSMIVYCLENSVSWKNSNLKGGNHLGNK